MYRLEMKWYENFISIIIVTRMIVVIWLKWWILDISSVNNSTQAALSSRVLWFLTCSSVFTGLNTGVSAHTSSRWRWCSSRKSGFHSNRCMPCGKMFLNICVLSWILSMGHQTWLCVTSLFFFFYFIINTVHTECKIPNSTQIPRSMSDVVRAVCNGRFVASISHIHIDMVLRCIQCRKYRWL